MVKLQGLHSMSESASKLRIDKWLWCARFFKTRGIASSALKNNKVECNGQKPKPSRTVNIGDTLKITQPHRVIEVKVLALSDKRSNAKMAQTLYEIISEQLNQKQLTPLSVVAGYREKGKGRPTKKERRHIDQLEFYDNR